MLTYGIPPEFRGGVHKYIETAIRHRVSPECIGSRKCVPMAFTAEITKHVTTIGEGTQMNVICRGFVFAA